MNEYTAYTEGVYYEQEDGTCDWLVRLYNRKGPGRVLKQKEGTSPSRMQAVQDVNACAVELLEGYKAPKLTVIGE